MRDAETGYYQLPRNTFALIMYGVSLREVRLRPRMDAGTGSPGVL